MNGSMRALWAALIIFASAGIATAGGLLAWAGGANPFDAVRAGGGTFGASVFVLFAIFYFVTHSGPKP